MQKVAAEKFADPSSEQPSWRSTSPSRKLDMQIAHCDGWLMHGRHAVSTGRPCPNLSSSASVRCCFSMQPASLTLKTSIRRLSSPTGI